ncbi:hypothetical protein [Niabella ginsengisoli]|uniref:Uncharacterized protein n=1 Tax=Niabella ginsengisoli TaxID=522298 RepID=A0ABS9SIP1_9BACT|nr:hypothetical protein [Niabella ginsengisoli]MCH5598195.1 hypothetical protein [Niabella ginsengisoli]
MKKIVSILLIVVFVLQSGSQLWILATFYINRDYLASNICINRFDRIPVCKASCVLEEQLKANGEKQEKLPDLKVKEITLFSQELLVTPTLNIGFKTDKNYPTYTKKLIPQGFSHDVFHPPCTIS